MMALLSPRVWLAIVLAVFFAGANLTSYRAGRANVRAEWTAATLASNEATRQREKALSIANQGVDRDLQIDKARRAAADRATANSLRDFQTALAAIDHPAAPSGANGTGGLERELLSSCATALAELAKEADRLESKVVGLQGYVGGVCLQSTADAKQ